MLLLKYLTPITTIEQLNLSEDNLEEVLSEVGWVSLR